MCGLLWLHLAEDCGQASMMIMSCCMSTCTANKSLQQPILLAAQSAGRTTSVTMYAAYAQLTVIVVALRAMATEVPQLKILNAHVDVKIHHRRKYHITPLAVCIRDTLRGTYVRGRPLLDHHYNGT